MANPLIVPVFIPHQGCGHTCVFCNQRKIAGQYDLPETAAIGRMVSAYRASCRDQDRPVQLAFYGGSFTGIAPAEQERLLGAAQALKAAGLVTAIRLSTRPDYIDDGVLARLRRYQADIVELGVQSFDDGVLAASNRGHTAAQAVAAARMVQAAGLQLGIQLMVALPGDTPVKSLASARQAVALGPDMVRIYPTAVIAETALAEQWRQGTYIPWDFDVLLDTVADMTEAFDEAGIPVIRVGLQAADNLVLGQDLLAGAYHPAMGELVKSRRFRRRLARQLPVAGQYHVRCHPRDISQVIGQKGANIHYFAQRQITLTVAGDEAVPRGSLCVEKR